MKFKEYPYKRPDEKQVLADIEAIKERLANAKSYEEFLKAFHDFDDLDKHVQSMNSLAYVRYTIDTRDEFYKNEIDFFNAMSPVYAAAVNGLVETIMASPYVKELEKDVPHTWFKQNEFNAITHSPEIVEDIQLENKTQSEYQKLIASAQIEFDGRTFTLEGLNEKMQDKDRSVRERATKAYWGWLADHEQEIGDIYDRLVKIRTRMAKKMGFDTYTPFGYMRMYRMDYGPEDVDTYRKQVLEEVVPVAMSLYKKQAERMGYEGNTLPAWDEKVEFETGNPTPKHDKDELVARALTMYKEMDPETGDYFQHMVDDEELDLLSTPGKAAGGYCTFIQDYSTPFIFANFNKTQHDAEVLTHEAGHGFQSWSSRNIFPDSCIWPTMESAEIDSMSMEFFAWPWMKSFFEEDVDKYYYSHLAGAVKFIPYGVLVDHFQHEVYAHPDWTNDQRMACWRELEKQYLPQKDYTGIDFLERGGWWMRQLHIFMHPFYYIDYTLAQAAALQFWKRAQDKDPQAFEDYKAICKAGGTKTFKELIELAHLKVSFEAGSLHETMEGVQEWYKDKDASNY